jgi:hypothetical protein
MHDHENQSRSILVVFPTNHHIIVKRWLCHKPCRAKQEQIHTSSPSSSLVAVALPFHSLNSGDSSNCLHKLVPSTPTPTTAHSSDDDDDADDDDRAMTDDDCDSRGIPPNKKTGIRKATDRRTTDEEEDDADTDDGRSLECCRALFDIVMREIEYDGGQSISCRCCVLGLEY